MKMDLTCFDVECGECFRWSFCDAEDVFEFEVGVVENLVWRSMVASVLLMRETKPMMLNGLFRLTLVKRSKKKEITMIAFPREKGNSSVITCLLFLITSGCCSYWGHIRSIRVINGIIFNHRLILSLFFQVKPPWRWHRRRVERFTTSENIWRFTGSN